MDGEGNESRRHGNEAQSAPQQATQTKPAHARTQLSAKEGAEARQLIVCKIKKYTEEIRQQGHRRQRRVCRGRMMTNSNTTFPLHSFCAPGMSVDSLCDFVYSDAPLSSPPPCSSARDCNKSWKGKHCEPRPYSPSCSRLHLYTA